MPNSRAAGGDAQQAVSSGCRSGLVATLPPLECVVDLFACLSAAGLLRGRPSKQASGTQTLIILIRLRLERKPRAAYKWLAKRRLQHCFERTFARTFSLRLISAIT